MEMKKKKRFEVVKKVWRPNKKIKDANEKKKKTWGGSLVI
jgi:hypothetical protein